MNFKKKIYGLLFLPLILEFLYLLIAGCLLIPSIFDRVFHLEMNDFSLHFKGAHSLIPGVVNLNDVTVAGQDANVRWEIQIPKVKVHLDLFSLTKMHLHFYSVELPTVAFTLKLKGPNEEWPEGPDEPLEEKKKHWQLFFDHISIQKVGKLEVGSFVFEGDGNITGQFHLWPGIEAEIGPAQFDIRSGVISTLVEDQNQTKAVNKKKSTKPSEQVKDLIEDQNQVKTSKKKKATLSSEPKEELPSVQDQNKNPDQGVASVKKFQMIKDLTLTSQTKFDLFKLDEASGNQVFDYLNIDAKISGEIRGKSLLEYYLKQTPHIRVLDSDGNFQSHFSIRKGVFEDGRYEMKSSDSSKLRFATRRMIVEGKSHLLWMIQKNGERPVGLLQVNLHDIEVLSIYSRSRLIEGTGIQILAETTDLSLKSLFSDMSYTIDMPKAKIPDIKKWNTLFDQFPFQFNFQSGTGSVEAHLQAQTKKSANLNTPKNRKNQIQFELKDLHGQVQTRSFVGNIDAHVDFSFIDLKKMQAKLRDLHISLNHLNWDYSNRKGKTEIKDWEFDTKLSSTLLDFGDHPSIHSAVSIHLSETKPILDLFDQKYHLEEWKYRLLDIKQLQIGFFAELNQNGFKLQDFQLQSKSAQAEGHLKYGQGEFWGAMRFKMSLFSLGIKLQGKKNEFKLFPSDQFLTD